MPFNKLTFQSGIVSDITPYSNEGGYVDCDKIRFRLGYPEKIGGWVKQSPNTYLGSARRLFNWVALDGSDLLGVGTHLKYYIEEGQTFNDITPIRNTTALGDITFSATNGSKAITVIDPAHGANENDFVTFSGAATLGGTITATILNAEHQITSIISSNSYTITSSIAANSSDTGNGTFTDATCDYNNDPTITMDSTASLIAGGTVSGTGIPAGATIDSITDGTTFELSASTTGGSVTNGTLTFNTANAVYQINTGLDVTVGGTGWGAGQWSGTTSNAVATTINEGGTFSNSDTTLTVTSSNPTHQIATNDVILIENELMLVTNVSTNDLTVVRAYAGSGAASNVNTANHGSSSAVTDAVTHADGTLVRLAVGNEDSANDFVGWGNAASVTVSGAQIRLWSHDNFGEDLILNARDGGIFYWDKTNGFSNRAVELSTRAGTKTSVPTIAKQILISDQDRHLIVFGCDGLGTSSTATQGDGVQDPLLIRFSSQENPLDFFPTTTNTAGDLRLGGGSEFVQAVETKEQILVYTNKTLHSMRFIGPPFTFGIKELSKNITIMSPSSAIAIDDSVYWMGVDTFYVYSGATQQLPCSVKDKIFLDLNIEERDKVHVGANTEFGEVIWFYPSASSTEIDKYVIYNYIENVWYFGTLARQAWLDRGIRSLPLATGSQNLFNHETGFDDDGSAMTAFVESAPLALSGVDRFSSVSSIIPDVNFAGSTAINPSVDFTIKARTHSGSGFTQTDDSNTAQRSATTPVEAYTNKLNVRVRGRTFALRVESTSLGTKFKVGSPQVNVVQDGRR